MSWRTKQVAVVNMSTVVVLLPLIVAGCSNSTSDEPVSTVDDVSLDVTAADASPVDVAPSIDSAGGDAAADAQDAQDTQDAPVCPRRRRLPLRPKRRLRRRALPRRG